MMVPCATSSRKNAVTPKTTDRVLIAVAVLLVAMVILSPGRLGVLTGQGTSMRGPHGLRDGARELCVPLGWRQIRQGGIYEFLDPQNERCLKRAAQVQGEWVWFLGDNQGVDEDGQPESIDSRSFGWVHQSRVKRVRLLTLPRCFDGPTSASQAAVPGRTRTAAEQKAIEDRGEALLKGHETAEEAKGFIESKDAILGPIGTRPASVLLQVPKGAKRVRWNLSTPPVMPEAKVEICIGAVRQTGSAPAEMPAGINGSMETKGGRKLRLKMMSGEAVQVSLRFYSK